MTDSEMILNECKAAFHHMERVRKELLDYERSHPAFGAGGMDQVQDDRWHELVKLLSEATDDHERAIKWCRSVFVD